MGAILKSGISYSTCIARSHCLSNYFQGYLNDTETTILLGAKIRTLEMQILYFSFFQAYLSDKSSI